MSRDINTMAVIMKQKELDIAAEPQMELNAEGVLLAEGKRLTFDLVELPSDPLR